MTTTLMASALTASAPRRTRPATHRTLGTTALELRVDDTLPPGICGRVTGVALTYNVVDAYDTLFVPGCAKRSIDTKVAARKVPLLMDHERSVKAHVGVVAAMVDTGAALVMTAELFDTPEGRAALDYCKTILAADAATGFSIGFVPRRSDSTKVDGAPVVRFLEIELREVSLTPMPAVPGTGVTGARTDNDDDLTVDTGADATASRTDTDLLEVAARVALEALPPASRAAVLAAYLPTRSRALEAPAPGMAGLVAPRPQPASIADAPRPAAHAHNIPTATGPVSMAARVAAVRASYAVPAPVSPAAPTPEVIR